MKNVIKDKNIDGYKVAMAFRQLESSDVLHECYDIEEEGVENILHLYGIFYKWTDEEKAIIKEQLMEMAAREEIKEAERWAEIEADPLLASIPDRNAPSPQILELQQKIRKAEREKQKKVTDSGEAEPHQTVDKIYKEIKIEVK